LAYCFHSRQHNFAVCVGFFSRREDRDCTAADRFLLTLGTRRSFLRTLYTAVASSTVKATERTPSPWRAKCSPNSLLSGSNGDWKVKTIYSGKRLFKFVGIVPYFGELRVHRSGDGQFQVRGSKHWWNQSEQCNTRLLAWHCQPRTRNDQSQGSVLLQAIIKLGTQVRLKSDGILVQWGVQMKSVWLVNFTMGVPIPLLKVNYVRWCASRRVQMRNLLGTTKRNNLDWLRIVMGKRPLDYGSIWSVVASGIRRNAQ